MQYDIVEEFSDAKTGQKYLPGNRVMFTEERAEEILKIGLFIRLIPEEPEKPAKKSK